MSKTIVFIHGMFLNPKCWEHWISFFSQKGYHCIAPAWPLHDGEPASLRANIPAGLGDITLADLIQSVESIVDGLDEKPILIGHSLGGLVAQVLANKGKASAAVLVSTVAPNAMLSFEWTFIKSTFPILNPLHGNSPQEMTPELFHQTFTNTLPEAEARAAYEAFAVHESRQVLRTALGEAGHVDLKRPHAPLLFLSGKEDAIIPDSLVEKNFDAYPDETGVKHLRKYEGRGHFIFNEPGHEQIMDYVAGWLASRNSSGVTRRQALSGIGGIGAGLALGMIPQILSAQGKEKEMAAELDNPLNKYPMPPFKAQTQPWPGLANKMDPKPDHGETSYKGSGRLRGRKALITGGDSGMGRAAAIAYAREGADVAINYLPAEESDAKEVIALIKAEGRKAIAIPGDLREEAFCQKLVADAISGLGGLDIVVCNAGRQQSRASILDLTTEDFDATMKTNIYAPFWIIKAALPSLPPGSTIIGTTSEQAYDPSGDLYDYGQTKAATMNYVKSLSKQLAPKGIRVNGVAPGPVWTPLQISGGASPEKYQKFGSWTPFGRPGQPAELASIYVQLAASDASFATGQIYGSSGGAGQP